MVVYVLTPSVLGSGDSVPDPIHYFGSEVRSNLLPTGLLFVTLSDEAATKEFYPDLQELIKHKYFKHISRN